MKTAILSRRFSFLAFVTASIAALHGDPRNPMPPWPERTLLRWDFDEPYSFLVSADRSRSPILDPFWVESWSGYSLDRRGDLLSPVAVPMRGTDGMLWVAPFEGTIRFWYSPDWSSGEGPREPARLVSVVTSKGKAGVCWWELLISEDGTMISVESDSDAGKAELLRAKLDWQAGSWHMVALEYAPDQTVLHVDDELAAVGGGLNPIPERAQELTSLLVGSDEAGSAPARGQIDELATFDFAYPTEMLAQYYRAMRPSADLGPVVSWEAERSRIQAEAAARTAQESEAVFFGGGMNPLSGQTGFSLLNPWVTNSTVSLTLTNADPLRSYEIYFTPLLTPPIPWILASSGTMGQTNFSLSRGDYDIGFYRAAEGNDWDGDGVPNYRDARPSDATIGALTVTIESPANGSTIN